jgi:hypothetical protein
MKSLKPILRAVRHCGKGIHMNAGTYSTNAIFSHKNSQR